jgi:hypothetical protein
MHNVMMEKAMGIVRIHVHTPFGSQRSRSMRAFEKQRQLFLVSGFCKSPQKRKSTKARDLFSNVPVVLQDKSKVLLPRQNIVFL